MKVNIINKTIMLFYNVDLLINLICLIFTLMNILFMKWITCILNKRILFIYYIKSCILKENKD